MRHARVQMHFDLDVRLGQPRRELEALVPEPVEPSHVDVRRRQTAQILRPRGCAVGRHVRLAAFPVQVSVPAHVDADDPVLHGAVQRAVRVPVARGRAVVEHRVDEQLLRDRGGVASIACEEGQTGSEEGACAFADEDDAAGVDAECVRVGHKILQGREAVLHGRRVGMLRRETVVHAEGAEAEVGGEERHDRTADGIDGTRNAAAAVEIQHGRLRAGGGAGLAAAAGELVEREEGAVVRGDRVLGLGDGGRDGALGGDLGDVRVHAAALLEDVGGRAGRGRGEIGVGLHVGEEVGVHSSGHCACRGRRRSVMKQGGDEMSMSVVSVGVARDV